MDNHNNNNQIVKQQQQADTPPRNHAAKFKIDVSDPGGKTGDDGMQKARTTMNSSKLKDQDTASGATKRNSAIIQSSIQGQQIGISGLEDEKENADDKDNTGNNNNNGDEADPEGKGWTIFKVKTWKNIFVKKDEQPQIGSQVAGGKQADADEGTKGEDNTTQVIKDTTSQKPKEEIQSNPEEAEAPKEKQGTATSGEQIGMELKEMKHNLQCECDKDATYGFACKNGVWWFAANVIALKIRR